MQATGIPFAGKTPVLKIRPSNPEAEKYIKLWDTEGYRKFAPGEHVVPMFLQHARPAAGESVIDFGCGTGRASLMMALPPPMGGNLKVTMLDFTANCLDEDIRNALSTQSHVLSFVQADLEKPIPKDVTAKYGFCTDVMEHIPPEKVEQTLRNILRAAQFSFFQICLVEDGFGAQIGEKLHLTVKPYLWWLERFRALGAVVLWSDHNDTEAMFYVSNWSDCADLIKTGVVNTPEDTMLEHIRSAVAREIQQVKPHQPQDTEVMILGGGPSLAQFEDEIRRKRMAGAPLVTTNGTYNWALERGIIPSAQVVVDARDHNARFVEPAVPSCRYLIASQCHPNVLDKAPVDQTYLWHSGQNDKICAFLDEFYAARGQAWHPVPGGSTVMLRTFCLLRMLGFWRFQVYGFDSCLVGDTHHAYEQKENDGQPVIQVRPTPNPENRVFDCHSWMASQAQEFMDQVKMMGDDVEMIVHGDGLIAYLLKTGADIDMEK